MIRPIIQTLEATFRDSWHRTPRIAFDECVFPATLHHNTTRQYIPNKPHWFSAKLFMLCDSASSFCFKFESSLLCQSQRVVYCCILIHLAHHVVNLKCT